MIKKSEKIENHREKKNGKNKSSYGPVLSLEEHVSIDWWKNIFNSLYLKTDGDVVENNSLTVKEIDEYVNILKITKDDRILDLCCGQGRHSIELFKRGFINVEGLDRSHYLIQKAKTNSKSEKLDIKFREGDARKISYQADTFNIVTILGNSFGYFETVNDDLRVLKEVFRVLRPWGKLLIDVTDGKYIKENFQPRSWEWIDKKHFVCRERTLSFDKSRLITREVITHVEKGVIADQFYAERLYDEITLKELLESVGFADVTFHGSLVSESSRNQDLGMMEKRIVLTAVTKKDWTKIKKRKTNALKEVIVIMGDPKKPDPMKPMSVFDDDDFYTINQLKGALRELNDYSFTFLDKHDTLINDLIKLKGKRQYVFNLCDEGYDNDPKKELIVPAILEALDIPYSGSGPQCLANCYDKSLVRGIAREMNIPVPEAFLIKPEDNIFGLPFNFPVIVKPNFGDSSFGITQRSVAYNVEEMINAISEIRENFGYDKPLLVEEFLTGMDLSVGIIGNPPDNYNILPITYEDYSILPENLPPICGYEAKWLPESPYFQIKTKLANLSDELEKGIAGYSIKLIERLNCRDYTRLDWRLDSNGEPKLLEINPNPGWCWDGHLAKMSHFSGLTYKDMLKIILEAAEQRMNLQ
jgi:D-alanine-D-alanine ligase